MIQADHTSHKTTILEAILPDLTPMLDVMFILLIFFILTANAAQKTFDLSLPEKGSEYAKTLEHSENVTVYIQRKQGGA